MVLVEPMTEPRTEAGRALLADVRRDESILAGMAVSPGIRFGPQFFEALEDDILAIEAEAMAEGEAAAESQYLGAIAVLRHAEEQGFPIHIATRSTCAEHIEEGDDTAESWALQPSLVLDVERLVEALGNVTGQRWDGKAIAAEYARLWGTDR